MQLIVGALVGAIAAVPAALLYAAKQMVDYNEGGRQWIGRHTPSSQSSSCWTGA